MKRAVATAAIALTAFTGLMGVLSAQEKQDEGPAQIDVSNYSPDMQKSYQVFAKKCANCHTLARAINADYALDEEWERDLALMMRKAGKMISPDEGKQIYEFLVYDSKIRKKDLYERKLADALPEHDLTPSGIGAAVSHPGMSVVTLRLSEPIVIGTQTVTVGEYKFECKSIDERETMIVTSVETGREVARVPCTPVALAQRIDASQYQTAKRRDGTVVLKEVRIEGETWAHTLLVAED